MHPFYQGQIDVFCAMYAVLNGLRLTHAVRALTARNIFHATLIKLAEEPQAFKDALEQKTDYYSLVDTMLVQQAKAYPLLIERPFEVSDIPSPDVLWTRLKKWFDGGTSRAVLLRFVRFLPLTDQPYIHHWTCARGIEGDVLQLFDSSREDGAIHSITQNELITTPDAARYPAILVEAQSLRLMTCKFHHSVLNTEPFL